MLTTVDTLVILTGFGLCWIGAAIALDRIIKVAQCLENRRDR